MIFQWRPRVLACWAADFFRLTLGQWARQVPSLCKDTCREMMYVVRSWACFLFLTITKYILYCTFTTHVHTIIESVLTVAGAGLIGRPPGRLVRGVVGCGLWALKKIPFSVLFLLHVTGPQSCIVFLYAAILFLFFMLFCDVFVLIYL